MPKYNFSDFYCINCGKKGIPIGRNKGQLRGKFHRKKLYCPNCKIEVNHVECKSEEEALEFEFMFQNGEFELEARESIQHYLEGRAGLL